MGDFRKPRFGAGNRDAGRGGFGGPRREERELFQATCSNCNKACEVPFRPNGKKPVFCKDCFVRPEGDAPRSFDRSDAPRSFDRRDERPRRDDRDARPAFAPAPRVAPDTRIDDVLRTVSVLSQKLDTVIDLIRRQQLHVAIQEAVKPDQKPKTKAVKPKTKKK